MAGELVRSDQAELKLKLAERREPPARLARASALSADL